MKIKMLNTSKSNVKRKHVKMTFKMDNSKLA